VITQEVMNFCVLILFSGVARGLQDHTVKGRCHEYLKCYISRCCIFHNHNTGKVMIMGKNYQYIISNSEEIDREMTLRYKKFRK
jgi:hypothetical protein